MKSKPNSSIEKLKAFIRSPYAWPGGYPLYALMGDSGVLCKCCAKTEYKRIVSDTMQGYDKSFQVTAIYINWEDAELYCDHCGEKIECAYSDD